MVFGRSMRSGLLAAAAASVVTIASPAYAQEQRQDIKIEAQDLKEALKAVSRQTGQEVIFSDDAVEGKRSPRVAGKYTAEEAVQAALAGSGLTTELRGGAIVIGGRAAPSGEIVDRPTAEGDILVTGTRLRNTARASQVITLSRDQVRDAGQSDLAQVIASLPQNFNGGQSPGLGFGVPISSGENVGSGSSLNLRGLGQDATLTLVNGHRLAYGGYRQNIDVSAIPLIAVERIEIVPDGASAIYGSDAVAGVANVILRKKVSGLEVDATVGASTDGGNQTQQYSLLAGTAWKDGSVVLAYEFGANTAIDARQRSYTDRINAGLTLFPALSHHNLVLIGDQEIGETLKIAVDALVNWRTSENSYSLDGLPASPHFDISSDHFSIVVAPSAEFRFSDKWRMTVSGTYGNDEVKTATDQVQESTITPTIRACFCNASWSAEVGITGDIITLPGGDIQIAAGVGIRSNTLHALRTLGGIRNVQVSQRARFAYGELSIPLVSAAQEIPFLHRLTASAAIRYEDYPGVDRVTTPKLGLVFEPFSGLQLRGSWGRSFKAPTLFQLYGDQGLSLRRASTAGGGSLPSAATILLRTGGNPNLQPEHATTWSVGGVFRPAALSGLTLEINYFNVRYRDRIVLPIPFLSQALSNPIYANYVTRNPSPAQQADALDGRNLQNLAGAPYDPTNVVAIVEFGNTNASEQRARGIDFLAAYDLHPGARSALNLSVNVSYLKSEQRLSQVQPSLPMSGILYNPPSWRGRTGAVWKLDATTLALHANYTGGVRDTRTTPFIPVDPMFTLDLSFSQEVRSQSRLLDGLVMRLSGQNILNDKPDTIATNLVYTPAYDSTNYSPFGRVISLTLSKRF